MDNRPRERLYGLDHLRALAIFYVFLFHYFILSGGQPEWLPEFAAFGWSGVDLFFVLSGFLISNQLFIQIKRKEHISFFSFFLKRSCRILPAFWVTVCLYFLVPLFREKEALPPLWRFLTFTQNFSLNFKDFGTFSHAWSLCVEEHFYLFLPLVLILLQYTNTWRKSYLILLIFFLLGMAVRLYSYKQQYLPVSTEEDSFVYWYRYLYYPTYNRLDGLLVGVSIAYIYQFLPRFWLALSAHGNAITILSLSILLFAYFVCTDQMSIGASVLGFPIIAIGYGCAVVGAISPGSFLFNWKSKTTYWLAMLSYGIYLTHKGVIHLTHQLLEDYIVNSNVMLLVCMLTCLGFATILYFTIEKPFMRYRDSILGVNGHSFAK